MGINFLYSIFFIFPFSMMAQPKYSLQTKIDLPTFESIKKIILEKGDRKTYRNFDNNNPHYSSYYYEVFLGSDVGQKNSNNDQKKSDFNELAIFSKKKSGIDLRLIAVRKGDLESKKYWITSEMKEGFVYLEIHKNIPITILENEIELLLRDLKKSYNKGIK